MESVSEEESKIQHKIPENLPNGLHMDAVSVIYKLGGKILDFDVLPRGIIHAVTECKAGHIYDGRINLKNAHCRPCALLKIHHCSDQNIVFSDEKVTQDQTLFQFKCGKGHQFITAFGKPVVDSGCPCCDVLKIAIGKHDPHSQDCISLDTKVVYVNNFTKLRWHCNKLRHNPKCENAECVKLYPNAYSPECKDLVRCNQDFYATASMIILTKSIFHCVYDHSWENNGEIIKCLRLFEVYFNDRFDDYAPIRFTGYNEKLSIAFIHLSHYNARNIKFAESYCKKNAIKLFIIPENMKQNAKIAVYVFNEMVNYNMLIGETPRMAIQKTRTKIRQMIKNHKSFDDRCIY